MKYYRHNHNSYKQLQKSSIKTNTLQRWFIFNRYWVQHYVRSVHQSIPWKNIVLFKEFKSYCITCLSFCLKLTLYNLKDFMIQQILLPFLKFYPHRPSNRFAHDFGYSYPCGCTLLIDKNTTINWGKKRVRTFKVRYNFMFKTWYRMGRLNLKF